MNNKTLLSMLLMTLLAAASACQAAPETPTVAPTVAFTATRAATSTFTPSPEPPTATLEPTPTPIPDTPSPTAMPSATPDTTRCPGAPPSRLAVGQMAVVNPPSANRVRSEPSRQAALVGEVQPGETVQLIDGPACGDNYVWWKVQNEQGLVGWTSEGTGNEYWLNPKKARGYILYTVPIDSPVNGRLSNTLRAASVNPSSSDRRQSPAWPPVCASVSGMEACHNFLFSPDKQWMAFHYGSTAVSCGDGQALMFVNLATEETHLINNDARLTAILPNQQALVGLYHCEGGTLYQYDFKTEKMIGLGTEGGKVWNAARTAFVINENYYQGFPSLWSFNVVEGRQIKLPGAGYEDHLILAPDGVNVVYQHRAVTRAENQIQAIGPREIAMVNPATGETRTLLSDANYDYHLCDGQHQDCYWQGDWIELRRILFENRPYTGERDNCRDYGVECASPVELFAFNWRTGELVPWAQAALPAATPLPAENTLSAPDLNSQPIYTEPSGAYAFYVGLDGHNLWLVPANGAPQLWVPQGENFVYVP